MTDQHPPHSTVEKATFKAFYSSTVRLAAWELKRQGCRTSEVREELLQDVYLEAYRGWDKVKNPEARTAWLLTIARRTAFRWRKQNKQQAHAATHDQLEGQAGRNQLEPGPTQTLVLQSQNPSPEQYFVAKEQFDSFMRYVDRQGEPKCFALYLFFIEAQPLRRIAEQFDLKTSTLTTWMHRARQDLKTLLSTTDQTRPNPGTTFSRLRPTPSGKRTYLA